MVCYIFSQKLLFSCLYLMPRRSLCYCAHLTRRYSIFKDHITLEDYEIHDGMGLELYYI